MTPVGAVRAEVHDQIVTLTGTVVWHYEREVIEHAIARLAGVHGVTNRIVLKPEVHVSSGVAKSKIGDALRRNASIEAEHIKVEVAGDKITLTGKVATWAERSQAGQAAWATPGVTHLANELVVTR